MLSEKDAVFPQIPQSTLIIVDNSYNNVTNTFTFIVQNTQDTLVYAQLYARFDSLKCGFLGDYHSSVNSFEIGQNTIIQLDLHSPLYFSGCSDRYVSSIEVKFIASDINVSPNYTFDVVPVWFID